MTKKPEKDWKKFKEENTVLPEAHAEVNEPDDLTPGALDHPSYVALEEKLTLAEQQAHDYREKSVRAMAELDNIRRRAERDVENAHRYGLEKFSAALLPVADSLEQALQLADKETDANMREGLLLTMQLMVGVLDKFDVKQLDPLGEVFNPQLHEAMSMQGAADVPPNTVLMVLQKGYTLNDRVIRPARVIVSKEIAAS